MRRWIVVALLTGASHVSAQEMRDSAGIRIVENGAARPSAWTVAAAPEVTIGLADGPPAYLLTNVEAVRLLSDGRIAVADRGSGQVRFFGLDGLHQGSVGGLGEGPGEFRWLGWIGECEAGTVQAFDPVLGRITSISVASLRVVDTWMLRAQATGRPPTDITCAPEGGWVALTRQLGAPPATPAAVRWGATLDLVASDGQVTRLAELAGDDRYFDGSNLGPLALGRRTVFSAGPASVVAGTQDRPELTIWHPGDGTPPTLTRWTDTTLAVSDADRRAYVNRMVERAQSEEDATRLRSAFRDYPFPERRPAHGMLLVDDDDRIWAEAAGSDVAANRWLVFSDEGVLEGTLEFPLHFTPHDVRDGRVAGVATDALGVESVWVLRVEEPNP